MINDAPHELSLDDILAPMPQSDISCTSGEPVASGSDVRRNAEWHRFEADLRSGLIAVKQQVKVSLREGKDPKKVSVAWVLREAGRGRSQFYASHPEFEKRIHRLQRASERFVAIKAGKTKRQPGKTALMEEIRELKARLRELEAREISKLAAAAFVHAFPRDVSILTAENNSLKADVARLMGDIENLRSYVRSFGHHHDIPGMKAGNVRALPARTR